MPALQTHTVEGLYKINLVSWSVFLESFFLKMLAKIGYSYLEKPTLFGNVWIYFKNQLTWPDVLRWEGSVSNKTTKRNVWL